MRINIEFSTITSAFDKNASVEIDELLKKVRGEVMYNLQRKMNETKTSMLLRDSDNNVVGQLTISKNIYD